jgi:hypothetical protein
VYDVDWGNLPVCPSEHSQAMLLPAEPSSNKSGGSGAKKVTDFVYSIFLSYS